MQWCERRNQEDRVDWMMRDILHSIRQCKDKTEIPAGREMRFGLFWGYCFFEEVWVWEERLELDEQG